VTALAANAVNTNEQGAAAGTIAAAQGLGIIAGPLVGTLVYDVDPGAPYALIAALLALAALWPARARTMPALGAATRR
jgi:MFS family permease